MTQEVDKKIRAFLGNARVEYVPREDLSGSRYTLTKEGLYWEDSDTQSSHPSGWFVREPYMAGLLDLSGGVGFGADPWGPVCGVWVLPCRCVNDEWEIGLRRTNPFGAFGKPMLRPVTRDWLYNDELSANATLLFSGMCAPNLARLSGRYEYRIVKVDATYAPADMIWFGVNEIEALVGHEAVRTAELLNLLCLIQGDSYGLLSGGEWSCVVDRTSFTRKLAELEGRGKPVVFRSGISSRTTDWRVRRAGFAHKDGRFFTVKVVTCDLNGEILEFPGVFEEAVVYMEADCEKPVGEIQLPVRVVERTLGTSETDAAVGTPKIEQSVVRCVEVGLTAWNRPGNGGATVYIAPRASVSNLAQLPEQERNKIVWSKEFHTYVSALTGIVAGRVVLDPAYKNVTWFTLDEVALLAERRELCDISTLWLLRWTLVNKQRILNHAQDVVGASTS